MLRKSLKVEVKSSKVVNAKEGETARTAKADQHSGRVAAGVVSTDREKGKVKYNFKQLTAEDVFSKCQGTDSNKAR